MSTYADIDDFKAWTDMDPLPADPKIQRSLDRAETQIDGFLTGAVNPDTGRRLVPTDLPDWQLAHLKNAVSAQTEYRLEMGEEFFQTSSNDEVVQGPDFTISGRRSRFSPMAAAELKAAGLLLIGARAVP